MAEATLTEEQLQNSLANTEEDAEFEEDDEAGLDTAEENADSAADKQLQNGLLAEQELAEGEEEVLDDEDDEMSSADEEGVIEDEEEEVLEEDDGGDSDPTDAEDDSDNADLSEEDGEENEDGEEDEEGVGAVKIQPKTSEEDDADVRTGSEDDDDDSDPEASDPSVDGSEKSSDVEAEEVWQPAANEEEERDEIANPNRCVFCQQDEENDPSEEFELYLACGICGDNAHRQCARNANALKYDDEADVWYCLECVTNNLVPDPSAPDASESLEQEARRISRDRIAGDLLPPSRGAIKPDSHSVFNQLITPEDPMDGSRLLRKRKTPSDETEQIPEEPITSRRRTRDREQKAAASRLDTTRDSPLTNGNIKTTVILTNPRASRSLRPKSAISVNPRVTILEKTKTSIKVSFKVNPEELLHISSMPPKPKKKSRANARARATSAAPIFAAPGGYTQPFYSLHDREMDELKSKPYGGILTEQEADTSLTLPKPEHRRQFDEARQQAEEDWKDRVAAAAEIAAASGIKKSRKVSGPASQIEYIEFGQYQIDIWYAAPYPEEYSRNKALFICEFCLKYMESDIVAWRHKTKCPWKHPPGDEIYRDGKIMIFEVDGRKNPLYCQNLCLLAKLFLGSKTLYYDVEPFLFYVMTEYDELGCHFVGYFSKEKRPSSLNNVSCILVLPIHQRKGYGHLLIDFSYLLTRVEKKTGSPEKPLSDMGLVSYRNYWRLVLCYYLRGFKSGDKIPSIRQISDDMGLTPDDVISALDALGALMRDPVTGTYAFKLKTEYYHEVIRQHEVKDYAKLNPKGLVWTPYIMGRGNASAFEHAPPLNTVAPREEDEDEETGLPSDTPMGKPDLTKFANGSGLSNGVNVDTDGITTYLGKLTTESGGDTILVAKPNSEIGGTFSDTSSSKLNGFSNSNSSSKHHNPSHYYDAAATIPPTRFEVYPLPSSSSQGNKSRPSARPTPSRTNTGSHTSRPKLSSRPRARRPASSSRRASGDGSRRRASTGNSRRRSGGTGRGPGRWPKGTKKSDFGNAESGPGLPPRNSKQRSRLGNEVKLGNEEEDDESQDGEALLDEDEDGEEGEAILFETPAMRKRRQRDHRSSTNRRNAPTGKGIAIGGGLGKPTPRGQGLGKPIAKMLSRGKGKGKYDIAEQDDGEGGYGYGEDNFDGEDDIVMGDLDIDAEGEDE